VEAFNDFMVYVPFMRTKSASETIGNMQKFMNDCLFPVLYGQLIVPFRDDFDYIGGWKVKCVLPNSAETMNSSKGASRLGSPTPNAEHELLDDMEKVQVVCNFVGKSLNVSGVGILDWHNRSPKPFAIRLLR
jgi:hypothetical protein